MAHWTAHKAAWYPGRMRICGRRLLPFTLGHLRLLECIESPYLAGGRATRADTFTAVAIAAMPWRVARWFVGRPWWLSLAAWIVGRRDGIDWVWKEESEAFERYIEDCQWTPESYRKEGEKEDDASVFGYSSSFSLRLAVRLAGMNVPQLSRYPVEQVWDIGIIEALALAVTAAETSGRGYVTRDEMEQVEAMAAAQVAKEAVNGG
jgi:hypothetical protein